METPYHEGEIAIQELVGEVDRAILNSANIGNSIPFAAKNFVLNQQYCVLGWDDQNAGMTCSIWAGDYGFIVPHDELTSLEMDLDGFSDFKVDGRHQVNLSPGHHMGLLFIELSTRRRLRVNGKVNEHHHNHVGVDIDIAYPNCPKHIQNRALNFSNEQNPPLDQEVTFGTDFPEIHRDLINNTDTFFIASRHPDGHADVNHRGGPKGFIQNIDGRFRIPDYSGNSMFNTFGNIHLYPEVSLCIPDFSRNRQLILNGIARLDLIGSDKTVETGGTGRWWHFEPKKWVNCPINKQIEWTYVDSSPFNP